MKELHAPVARAAGAGSLALLLQLAAAPAFDAQVVFAPQATISAVPDSPRMVACADLDGDGDLDALSASAFDDDVSWYENTAGDGSAWVKRTILGTANSARAVAAADVDGDGDVDVLSAARFDDTLWWHENTAGDGSAWTEHPVTAAADGVNGVVCADLDGDGDVDVVAAVHNVNTVAWYENTAGDGSAWSPHTISALVTGANTVVCGDVDGDGDLDVLSAAEDTDEVAWHENTNGDASAWSPHTISSAADAVYAVEVGDVDGDGDLDALSASFNDSKLAWYENTAGDGSAWTEVPISTAGLGVVSLFPVDLDGDGDLDTLSASLLDNKVAWLENAAGDGSLWLERVLTVGAAGAVWVTGADVDGDGDTDLLSASLLDNKIAWYENATPPCPQDPFGVEIQVTGTYDTPVAPQVADMDGDGDQDVVAASTADQEIAWFDNLVDTGTFWSKHTISAVANAPQELAVADLDGDGDPDVAAVPSAALITWHRNLDGVGATWSAAAVSLAVGNANALDVGDVDRDGDLDLLSAGLSGVLYGWHRNDNGDASAWTTLPISAEGVVPTGIAAGDVDGDGDLDALTTSAVDDRVAWHENTAGDGSAWSPHVISTTFADLPQDVRTADVDGDGDLDVLTASSNDDRVAWFENTAGDGSTWLPATITTGTDSPMNLRAADVDRDGDVDVVTASRLDDQVAWFANANGDGSLWTPKVISTDADGVANLAVGDVDGDGFLDVASTSANDDKLAWYPHHALLARSHAVPLSTGGQQPYFLNGGGTFAGELYWVIGGASGTSPGFVAPPFVPLNFDGYTTLTIELKNILIQNSLGFLGALGAAQAALTIPAATDPTLAGARLHHLFAVIQIVPTIKALLVSNPVPVELIP